MKELISIFDLKRVEPEGLGFAFLNSEPGAFVVHECSAYDDPKEVDRFPHNGTARSRAAAYDKATHLAQISQTYDGTQRDYNVYEELEAPDGGLSSLTREELREVIRISNEIPKDLRRKQVTLRLLRMTEKADSPDNPYHIHPSPVTDRVWRPIFLCFTPRLNCTNENLAGLVKRALALLCPFAINDRVIYAGAICAVTAIRANGCVQLDRMHEVSPEEITLADVEPARNVADLQTAKIAEDIEREANDPRSTKPTARGYLAAQITTQLSADKQYGRAIDVCTFLHHLDNCCVYGVLNNQDHAAIVKQVKDKKGDFRRMIDTLCVSLLAGSDIANSLLSAVII